MQIDLRYFGNKVIEEPPFEINRPEGSSRYIFFHFISSVEFEIDNKIITVNPGNCILFSPKTKQYFHVDKNRLNHDYLDFTIDDDSFFSEIGFPINQIFNPFSSVSINELFENLKIEKQSGKLDSKYLISSYLTTFFIMLSRKLKKGRKTVVSDESIKEQFENLRLSIYQNPKNYSVTSMAESLHYSLPYFNSLYSKFLNVSPMIDLNNARKEYVEKFPREEIKIRNLMEELGFESEEYFYRWFKKTFKKTPKEYFAK